LNGKSNGKMSAFAKWSMIACTCPLNSIEKHAGIRLR
jgi:hypothetical protein